MFAKSGLRGVTGLTLVEVLIALVILLLVFLALMQTALISIDSNMINLLREDAVLIGDASMNKAKNTPFDSLAVGTTDVSPDNPPSVRNITKSYTVTRTVATLDTDNKQIDITVTWDWKEKTIAGGNPYTHTRSDIYRRPQAQLL